MDINLIIYSIIELEKNVLINYKSQKKWRDEIGQK